MATFIDDGKVSSLVSDAVAGIAGVAVFLIGQELPEQSNDALVVLLSMQLSGRHRNSNTDVDIADLRLEIAVTVGSNEPSAHSVGEVTAKIAKALGGATMRDEGTTHKVELGPVVRTLGVKLAADRAVKAGRVIVEGIVTRDSGETIAAYLT